MANLIILLGLLTHFNFMLVLSHYIATYNTHSLLFLYPNFDVFSVFIIPNDWHLRQLKKLIVVRFDDSIGGILLGNNNESDNPYFCFMNPFLSFKTRVFFSGEKLESCSYVLISLIFVYYVMNHSAYIFLYFLLDSFLGKDWWYTSHVTRTRMAIAKLFALHINSTRIVTITFLKFLKLTGNLLVMSSDITSFWSKGKHAKK